MRAKTALIVAGHPDARSCYLFAFILTYSAATPMTVIISGTSDTTGVQFWYVSTRMLMAILPPALLTLTVQRYIDRVSPSVPSKADDERC